MIKDQRIKKRGTRSKEKEESGALAKIEDKLDRAEIALFS
jgi:hypothetical protein